MSAKIDLAGQKIGLWTVIREAEDHERAQWQKDKNLRAFLCRCECGVERVVSMTALRSGTSRCCGAVIHRKQNIPIGKTSLPHERLHGEMHDCKINPGVYCDLLKCDGCGWTPEVEARRKEALKIKRC